MRGMILGAVLLLAATLRVAGLDFGGRDFEARPDENGVVVTLAAVERGGFFPMMVMYGGGYFQPLYLFVRAWGASFWGEDVGTRVATGGVEDVRVAARAWSALLALVTVALVYVVGRRVRGERVGLLAAALLAVLPLAVREAHFAKADTAAAAAGTLVMAALVLQRGPAWRRGLLVGGATALAISTKALLSVLPAVAFALAWRDGVPKRDADWRALAWAASACVLGMVALNAFLLRHPAASVESAVVVFDKVRDASWLPGADVVAGPLVYHATISLRWGCGLAVSILMVPAIAYGLGTGGGLRVIALLALGHLAALLASTMVLARFLLPALPALAILIAAMLAAAIDRGIEGARKRRVALVVVTLLVLAEPFTASVMLVRVLGRRDTRSLAGDWISTHLPPDARIVSWGAPPGAADYGRPPLGGRPVEVRLPPVQWNAVRPTYVVWHHHPLLYSSDPLPADATRLRPLATFDPFSDGRAAQAIYEPLDAFYVPVGRFAGVERPGPRIEILAVEPPDVD